MVMYAVANYSKNIRGFQVITTISLVVYNISTLPFLRNGIKDIKLLKTGLIHNLFTKCPIIILIWANERPGK